MNDKIANQIARRQAQIACADRPENKLVWEGQLPARFETKLDECRALVAALEADAGSQSADRTGVAKDKRQEERELEDMAYNTAGLLVAYAREAGNESLATKHDKTMSDWRRMRDEALLTAARELEADVDAVVAGPDALLAADYGVDAARAAALKSEADDYQAWIIAPRDNIGQRKQLTASLTEQVRNLTAQFDLLEMIARAFRGTAAGDSFYAGFVDAGQVIDLGHGPGTGSGGGSGGNGGGGGSGGGSDSMDPSSSSLAPVSSSSSMSYPPSSSSYFPSSSSWSSYAPSSSSYYPSSSSSLP
ncbi:MAG: hypothetical protein KDN20_23265 [Verrucomicrobiae bacterium]|nr:hypothetical protein [Verrucomicrobiae bacterium]